MVFSLKDLLLNSFSLREIVDLQSQVDLGASSWEFWRKRAQSQLKISPQYFDLARERLDNNGAFRYLEIECKFSFPPESLAQMVEGEIHGLYEPWAGVIEALRRNDEEGVLFFASSLGESEKRQLQDLLESGRIAQLLPQFRPGEESIFFFRTAALRALYQLLFGRSTRSKMGKLYPKTWQIHIEEVVEKNRPFQENLLDTPPKKRGAYLYLLSRGRMEFLPLLIEAREKYKGRLGVKDEDIAGALFCSGREELILAGEEYIPLKEVRERLKHLGEDLPQIQVPTYDQAHICLYLKACAFYSGNLRLVKMMASNIELIGGQNYEEFTFASYYVQRDPQAYHELAKHLYRKFPIFLPPDVDLLAWLLQEKEETSTLFGGHLSGESWLEAQLGYLPLLLFCYPLLNNKEKRELPQKLKNYPLSLALIQS